VYLAARQVFFNGSPFLIRIPELFLGSRPVIAPGPLADPLDRPSVLAGFDFGATPVSS